MPDPTTVPVTPGYTLWSVDTTSDTERGYYQDYYLHLPDAMTDDRMRKSYLEGIGLPPEGFSVTWMGVAACQVHLYNCGDAHHRQMDENQRSLWRETQAARIAEAQRLYPPATCRERSVPSWAADLANPSPGLDYEPLENQIQPAARDYLLSNPSPNVDYPAWENEIRRLPEARDFLVSARPRRHAGPPAILDECSNPDCQMCQRPGYDSYGWPTT